MPSDTPATANDPAAPVLPGVRRAAIAITQTAETLAITHDVMGDDWTAEVIQRESGIGELVAAIEAYRAACPADPDTTPRFLDAGFRLVRALRNVTTPATTTPTEELT